MKKRKAKSRIDLEKLAGGAFTEKLNEALAQVAENIQNPNTDASTKRGITVNISFKPSKNREMVSTTIQVTTKLAATEAIETQMVMGTNRAGEIEIGEYGQMTMDELEEETPKAGQTGEKTAASVTEIEASGEELEGDELLPDAVDVILETGQASVSMLQRQLKLGYARAARIVDEMEAKGIVGPFQGSNPRAILITKEQWAAMKSGQPQQPHQEGKPLDLRNRGKKQEEAPVMVAGRDYDPETGEVYETAANVVPFSKIAAQA